jgi:erythromycin esterase-like protein
MATPAGHTETELVALRTALDTLGENGAGVASLLTLIGDSSIVMLGEASHGTHEFYKLRAEITMRLIAERGFMAVLIEGDWPDSARVDAYVRGRGDDGSAEEALRGFERFPQWMWRNSVVVEFVEWLREHNSGTNEKAGFYGLDLYSLHRSAEQVVRYLTDVDPDAARHARERYGCFDWAGEDMQAYGYAASADIQHSCAEIAREQLAELQGQAARYASLDGRLAADAVFSAEQNARLVANAEQYYRSVFSGRPSSWNLRDTHMAETIQAVREHLRSQGVPPRVVVWAHNSHIGNARHTEMKRRGELNVGQLARERYGSDVVLVGFTTYTGTVTAARNWEEPAETRKVTPALPGSWEALLHAAGEERFLLPLRGPSPVAEALRTPRLERAIGVIYRPETERMSHYFEADLPQQFDAVLHVDETRALEPLELSAAEALVEPPESWPSGL